MTNKHKFMLAAMALACRPLNANAEMLGFGYLWQSHWNSDTLVLFPSAAATYLLDRLFAFQSTQDQLNLTADDNSGSGKQGEILEILAPSRNRC